MEGRVSQGIPDGRRGFALEATYEFLPVALIAVAALAAYWNATNYFFSEDDFGFLSRAKGLNAYPDFLAPMGSRLVSTQLYFKVMHGIFGMDAGPYHWASVLLHALNAVLVYAAARCWTGRRLTGFVAGAVFATLDLAFTAVFWISGVQDLLATTFMLVTALIWVSRPEKGLIISALSGATYALSLLSKETGILFWVVLLLLAWGRGAFNRRTVVALTPHIALSIAAAVLALAQSAKVSPGGAYETALSSHMVHNFATYVMWTVDVVDPFKDRVAEIDHGAWIWAAAAVVVVGLVLFTSRGIQGRRQWAALGWYVLAIAPVLPLVRHTFLYYIYPTAPGAAIFVGLLAGRLERSLSDRFSSRGALIAWLVSVAVAAGFFGLGYANVRSRESARLERIPELHADHVLRSSVVAENALTTFATIDVPEGADLILINPFEFMSEDLIKDKAAEKKRRSYDLVRSALRDGQVLRLQRPDIGEIDFTYQMDPKWDDRHALLYDGFGRLSHLGTGADIWVNLCSIHLKHTGRLADSIRCGRRALELAPDHPWGHLFLGLALAQSGREAEASLHLERAVERIPGGAMRDEAARALRRLRDGQR